MQLQPRAVDSQSHNLAFAFFAAAALTGLFGMAWGAMMGASQDFATAPAHAHLNLLGWVSLSLMGAFYATLGSSAPPRIVRLNWLLSVAGALALPTALALVLTGHRSAEPFIAAGGVAAIVGMAAFASAIALCWLNNGEAAKRSRSRVGAADEAQFGQGSPGRGVG
jgi:hypothetical protein